LDVNVCVGFGEYVFYLFFGDCGVLVKGGNGFEVCFI